MKTISVKLPEKLAKELENLGKELARQNNQGSSWPIWYVSEIKKVEAPEDRADFKERIHPDAIDHDNLCKSCSELYEKSEGYPDDCSNYGCNNTFWHYNKERGYASYGSCFFLTQKACQEYIDDNAYHFTDPKPYCDSAFRNDELQPLIQALILMAGEEIPSNHYGRYTA